MAYMDLILASPTTSPNQTLLTVPRKHKLTIVTVDMPSGALRVMLDALGVGASIFSLHSLRKGGGMVAYRAGMDQLDIKHYGMWTGEAFWTYIITAPCVSASPVTAALAVDMAATL